MKIAVIHPDGRVLTVDDINLGALNYEPTEAELFEQAKTNAIKDGLVDEKEAERLTFRIVT